MLLAVLLACGPEPGTYLFESESWDTTCSVGGGGFVEPHGQYLVEAYVESETALWFDENACTREGFAYTCADAPVTAELDASGESVLTVNRAWSGAWDDPSHHAGEVDWTTTCAGPSCALVELCDATWTYTATNVEGAM
jgi:hypothetical protein